MALEIRSMGQKLSQLDKIESDVGSLRTKIEGISTRTKDLEIALQNHSMDIKSVKSSLLEITTNLKQSDTSLAKLWTFTEDVASKTDQRVRELKHAIQDNIDSIGQIGDNEAIINKEVSVQIKDVISQNGDIQNLINKEVSVQIKLALQAFKQEFKKECGKQIRRSSQNTKNDLHNVINRNTHDFAYKNLQDQAFFNRHNLIIWGIQEHDRDSAFTQASNFFNTNLNLSRLSIDVAYPRGNPPTQGSSYNRPIVVKFSKISDRNTVWKTRNDISQQGSSKSIRIQPDIPKQLREDLQILYRVQNAARKTNQYQNVEVRNYRLYLDGAEYFAWELEGLPDPLRPSTLATKCSDKALFFYSKHTALSNHYPAPFEVRCRSYANPEQYLTYKKAKLSGQKNLIQKALHAQDPVEAKSILNTWHSDHQEEWKQEVSKIALEGLRAKFRQNPVLRDYLISTAPLTLGKASTNSQWGTGLSPEDGNALDTSKWNKQGNLLGRLLMKVRSQMINELQPQHTTPKMTNQNNGTQQADDETTLLKTPHTQDQPSGKNTTQKWLRDHVNNWSYLINKLPCSVDTD